MKHYFLFIILFSFLTGSTGCVSAHLRLHDNQIEEMKPFMERTTEEDKISISIPIYKF